MPKPCIQFFCEDVDFKLKNSRKTISWIKDTIKAEKKAAGELSFIFCSDNHLLQMNIDYLKHNTFTDSQVQAKLKNAILLQADVTKNSDEQGELLKRFGLFGPPGIVFFDPSGGELRNAKVIGYQAPEKFLASLDRIPGLN